MGLRRLKSLFRNVLHRKRGERELDEEIRSHELLLADEKIFAGMNPQEAHRQVHLELGGLEQVKEQVREMRAGHALETFFQDVRYGLRMLRKSPGFTTVAVLTLALGIGANTSIFSVVRAVLLRPLPYANSGQLIVFSSAKPDAGISGLGLSYPTFMELRDGNRLFSTVAGFGAHALVLTGDGEPSELNTVVVTPEFFSLLTAEPLLGRVFLPGTGSAGPRLSRLSAKICGAADLVATRASSAARLRSTCARTP